MEDNKHNEVKPDENSSNEEAHNEAQAPSAEAPQQDPQKTEAAATEAPEPVSQSGAISSPFTALQAIILKPNSVFSTLKNTANWSWVAFIFVTFFSVLPTWLYFNQIDMVWYSEMAVNLQMPDVSPSEKAQAMQMMQNQAIGTFTAFFVAIGAIILNAIFAFYLSKITQMDEDNVLSFGDWYGFTWWATLPFAFIGILNTLIILMFGGPQMSPEYLSVFSLAFVLGISMESGWFGWAQGIGLDSLWIIYLTAVGISQWTKLSSRQCTIIAVAPFAIIWGVWAFFLII
ncbi:Yip1 family protein [Planctobacterium marinum]|uniref:Yip1 domain-containing protein n=1 Tax=Planctobacterium marinum TaxID=1631968 RepID=A0AA48KSS4_9ALTE|nr:hypothetical protein MACH26_29780 [Planctobacterium marinum]